MRAIWKGAISFGLVNIPIALYSATRSEELKFRLLRESDQSPVNYKRVAEADGKEVPWDKIVKGYEYEKGKFILLKDDDFRRVDIEATQTVDIISFVKLEEANPICFHKPYYMEPQKGGDKAYVLLREALEASGKIAIAKVVIKTRQHLAAVKPQGDGLMLELMHFANELIDVEDFKLPKTKDVGKKELQMAKSLIDSMSDEWKPEAYVDEYRKALEKVIEDKLEKGDSHEPAPAKQPTATNASISSRSCKKVSSKAGLERKRRQRKRRRAPNLAARRPRLKDLEEGKLRIPWLSSRNSVWERANEVTAEITDSRFAVGEFGDAGCTRAPAT